MRTVKAELAIAGVVCFLMAGGHATIGLRWVLPMVEHSDLTGTPFGPRSLTVAMVRFTWHVVTLMVAGFGVLLSVLAWVPHADPKTLLLRWFAAVWLGATAFALWQVRRRPRSLLRLPVPVLFLLVGVLCGVAST